MQRMLIGLDYDIRWITSLYFFGWNDAKNFVVQSVIGLDRLRLWVPQMPETNEIWSLKTKEGGYLIAYTSLITQKELLARRPSGPPLVIQLPANRLIEIVFK